MSKNDTQHRGELCGNCTGYAAMEQTKREQCPGQWFIDLPEGERAICGLVAGVIAVVAHEKNFPGRGIEYHIKEIQNPLN